MSRSMAATSSNGAGARTGAATTAAGCGVGAIAAVYCGTAAATGAG